MNRRTVLLVLAVLMAVLGAGLVFVYAQDAEDRAAEQLDAATVLVAGGEIAPGETIDEASKAGKLDFREVPRTELLDGWTDDGDDLAGKFALTRIYPGEQLLTQKFGDTSAPALDDGQTPVLLDIDESSRLGVFTQPGARVSILATSTSGGSPQTDVLVEDALLLSVGSQTLDGAADEGVVVSESLVMVSVSDDDEIELTQAKNDPDVALSLGFPKGADPAAGTE